MSLSKKATPMNPSQQTSVANAVQDVSHEADDFVHDYIMGKIEIEDADLAWKIESLSVELFKALRIARKNIKREAA